jgi:NAD-dependent SIR2 family protein deacetylase
VPSPISNLSLAIDHIHSADAIAIFAGAGMSVDSGLSPFRGRGGIWTKSMTLDGKSYNYLDLMSHQAFMETPLDAWHFILSLKETYKQTVPHDGYYRLPELLQNKEYFIVTSNIDNHFIKAGFDENRIFECHGSIQFMQCMDILEREVWLTPDISASDLNDSTLPKCPNCNGLCRPNILMFGDWFWIPIRSVHQQLRYIKWCKGIVSTQKKIIAIEIGAGKTIQTIRKASENFAKTYPLFRVNPHDFNTTATNCRKR